MKRYVRLALNLVALLWSVAVQAGDWRVHTNVMTVRRLLADSGSVWAVTSGGLYRHDAVGDGFDIINVGDGLGGHDLWAAARAGDTFWVAGTGKVLSFWVAGTGETERFPLGLGTEQVQALLSMGDSLWLGSNRGVGLFIKNLEGGLLKEVYSQLGTLPSESAVRDMKLFGGLLWVATDHGVASADPRSTTLYVPGSWTNYADPDGALGTARRLDVFRDTLYAATDSGLYAWDGSAFVQQFGTLSVRDLFAESDTLWMATDSGAYFFTAGTHSRVPSTNLNPADLWSVVRAPGSYLWVGFSRGNLFEYGSFLPWFVDVGINQPRGSTFISLDEANAVLFCAQREVAGSFLRTDGLWGLLPGSQPSAGAPTLGMRSTETRLYETTSGYGVYIMDNLTDQITASQLNSSNSALVGVPENAQYTVVSDVALDEAGGFWAANRLAANGQALVYFGPGNTPQVAYGSAQGLTNNDVSTLLLTSDLLWIGYNGGGLGALEYKGTPESPGDDTYRVFTSSADRLPSDVITTLLADHHGRIWVGTPGGLARVDLEFYPFLTVEYADVRPADASILALAQDLSGAIWVGTNNGLARIPDGALVADSTWFEGTSALPANQVMSLKLDDWAPRLFIGTVNGLAERPVLATVATTTPNVFPNPFEIRYSGDRATFEVPSGSIVDIFTAAGDRVRSLSEGYQWDGRNEAGETVASGLYLFRVKYADGTTGSGRLGVVR